MMKLQLVRAMLANADILMLDEPTNHLDTANIVSPRRRLGLEHAFVDRFTNFISQLPRPSNLTRLTFDSKELEYYNTSPSPLSNVVLAPAFATAWPLL